MYTHQFDHDISFYIYPHLFSFSAKPRTMLDICTDSILNKARQSTVFIQPSKLHTGDIYLQSRYVYSMLMLDSNQHLHAE